MTMHYCPLCQSKIVVLDYNPNRCLCSHCLAIYTKQKSYWKRDHYAEKQWEKMASYVGKTYKEVFMEELVKHNCKNEAS